MRRLSRCARSSRARAVSARRRRDRRAGQAAVRSRTRAAGRRRRRARSGGASRGAARGVATRCVALGVVPVAADRARRCAARPATWSSSWSCAREGMPVDDARIDERRRRRHVAMTRCWRSKRSWSRSTWTSRASTRERLPRADRQLSRARIRRRAVRAASTSAADRERRRRGRGIVAHDHGRRRRDAAARRAPRGRRRRSAPRHQHRPARLSHRTRCERSGASTRCRKPSSEGCSSRSASRWKPNTPARRYFALNDVVVRKGEVSRIAPFGLRFDDERDRRTSRPTASASRRRPVRRRTSSRPAARSSRPASTRSGSSPLLPHTLFSRPLIVPDDVRRSKSAATRTSRKRTSSATGTSWPISLRLERGHSPASASACASPARRPCASSSASRKKCCWGVSIKDPRR